MSKNLIIRKEVKANEFRTAIIPDDVEKLVKAGIKVFVEADSNRVFRDEDYQTKGAEIVKPGSYLEPWASDLVVLGLKEIDPKDMLKGQSHIYFSRTHKNQPGAKEALTTFKSNKALVYDLEYLLDENNRRVCAFGFWAGFVGAGLALNQYFVKSEAIKNLSPLFDKQRFIEQIKTVQKRGICQLPKVVIVGAKGRSGTGAQSLLKEFGINSDLWDREETKLGGPFKQLASEYDIVLNCVLLQHKNQPFLRPEDTFRGQNLRVIGDISCDPGPLNPFPFYEEASSWETPFHRPDLLSKAELNVLAVDNLPALLPKESSEEFSNQLIDHLGPFLLGEFTTPWVKAKEHYQKALDSIK